MLLKVKWLLLFILFLALSGCDAVNEEITRQLSPGANLIYVLILLAISGVFYLFNQQKKKKGPPPPPPTKE